MVLCLPKTRLGKFFRTRLPSYLESKDFSKILTEIVAHELVTYRTVAKKLKMVTTANQGEIRSDSILW